MKLTRLQRRIALNIQEYGWHAQATEGSWLLMRPSQCHTVGLSEQGHTDLVVFGFEPHQSHAVISGLLHLRAARGRAFYDRERVRVVPEARCQVEIRDVQPAHHAAYFSVSQERAQVTGVPLRMQMVVMPDPHGCYGWDPQIMLAYADQPALWLSARP